MAMKKIGYKLDWEETEFDGIKVFACKDFPSVFVWTERGDCYIRMGEKLFVRKGQDHIDFEQAENFLIKKCKALIEKWDIADEPEGASQSLSDYLAELDMLVGCMFK